jgi:hypothetical protein
MPSRTFEEADARRLVILTFRKKDKSTADTVAPGAPPEQVNAKSPVLSVMPSPCTTGIWLVGTQVKVAALTGNTAAAIKNEIGTKKRRNMGGTFRGITGRGDSDYTCLSALLQ